MSTPTQKGTALVIKAAPTFDDYVVVDGTWKEKDATEMSKLKDHKSETINYSFSDPGIDASGTLVIKATKTPLKKGDVITTTETTPRSFMVVDAETSDYGGKPLAQNVTLELRESCNLAAE